MNSAYAVGRYKQQMEDVDFAPYFQYQCILDNRTRPAHKAMHGKVFRYDDPIWQTMYPPNGWNCRCFVNSLTPEDIKKQGLTVESSDGHIKEISTIVGKEEKSLTAYDFNVNGKNYRLVPDAGWNTNLGMHHNEVLNKELNNKINKINSVVIKKEMNLDITTHTIIENISKIDNINILTAHYKKYNEIIKKRYEAYNKVLKVYNRLLTKETYTNAIIYQNKYLKSIKQQDLILGKYIEKIIKSINTDSKSSINLGKIGKNLSAEALTLKKDLELLIKDCPSVKLNILETKNSRSYQYSDSIYLYNYKNRNCSNHGRLVSLHEAMHWLEKVDKKIGQKSIDFLEKRTLNDKEEKLSKITGIKYKPNEMAKKDNFFNAYCGKIYKNEKGYYATEILSMGLQELLSNPIEFYKNDKDYFKFVISILKGYF